MGKLLLIVLFMVRYSSVILSQLDTLIACPQKKVDTARCMAGDHIILGSIELIGKDTRCSSMLPTGSNPSTQTGCCNVTTGDMKLATFTLPSDDPTVNTKFKLAINSCSFDRDSCVIPTKAEVFQMDYGGRQVDVVAYKYRCLKVSQLDTLIACPQKKVDTARCMAGDHIILGSIELIGKDTRCSSMLPTGSNPSTQTGCCNVTTGDMKLATFTLPSDDPTVNTKFKLAINSCSFDRDSCVIPTKAEVFQMDYGGRQVDVVAYKYRCLKGKSAYSICGGTKPVKASSVVVKHDGEAAGAAVDCQCGISSSCNRRISVRITYRKNTDCSLQLKEGNSIRLVKCQDSVAVDNMESVGNTLMLKINSSETNTIALEISGTQGSEVSVKCGHNLQTFPHEACSTSTSTSSSTSAKLLSTPTSPSTSTSEPSLSTTTSPITSTSTTLKTTTYIKYHIMSSSTTQSTDTRPSPSSNLQKQDSLKYVIAGCVSGAVVIAFGTLLLVAYFRLKARVSPMMNREAHPRINHTY